MPEIQTDRQSKVKSCNWSITAYNSDIEKLESKVLPIWIKTVLGGREKCPTTGRIHGQFCINTEQVRFSQVKKFLPESHIEVAKNVKALQTYVMKTETAEGEKKINENTNKWMSMSEICMKIVNYYLDNLTLFEKFLVYDVDAMYIAITSRMIVEDITLLDKLNKNVQHMCVTYFDSIERYCRKIRPDTDTENDFPVAHTNSITCEQTQEPLAEDDFNPHDSGCDYYLEVGYNLFK